MYLLCVNYRIYMGGYMVNSLPQNLCKDFFHLILRAGFIENSTTLRRWTSGLVCKVWPLSQQHPGAWQKCRLWGPSRPVDRNLHFSMILLQMMQVNVWEASDRIIGSHTWVCIIGIATYCSQSFLFREFTFQQVFRWCCCCWYRDHTLRSIRLKHPFHCNFLYSLLILHSSK